MYNPHHFHVHETEKQKQKENRRWADRIMTAIGVIAAFTSLPQVMKIYETKDVAAISLPTYLIALGAVIAWFIYGLYIKNKPLIYTTFISIVINSIVIIQILIFH